MTLRVEVSGTQRITYTQGWDAENRLAVVTNTVTGQVTRFVYDGDGNRILRIDGSGTTVTIGDYYEQRGAVVTKYYYAGGQRIAVRAGGVVYWLHADHLGSATLTTDASGNRVGELRYTPYGVTRYEWGSTPTDRRYTGQRWDSALGLYDYRARYYSPGLGRFVSADTIVPEPGNPQALNRYLYVANNPLRHVDPSGHSWLTDQIVALGQRSELARGLIVSAAEAVHSLNDPQRSPTMEGIRQTYQGVVAGIGAWGDAAGMAGEAMRYTAAAMSEGRWEDASRGAAALGQMGNTVAAAGAYATAKGIVSIATAPFRDAWAFGVAAREYAAGERSGWDLAFHGLCLTGDVLAIGAAYNRLAGDRTLSAGSWQEAEQALSRHLGVPKNTTPYHVPGMSQPRIPDFVTNSYIADLKWYSASTLSRSAQLRDLARLAAYRRVPLDIYVRQSTYVTSNALKLIESTGGSVIPIFR